MEDKDRQGILEGAEGFPYEWRREWIKIFVNSRDPFYREFAIQMMENDCLEKKD